MRIMQARTSSLMVISASACVLLVASSLYLRSTGVYDRFCDHEVVFALRRIQFTVFLQWFLLKQVNWQLCQGRIRPGPGRIINRVVGDVSFHLMLDGSWRN